MIDVVIPIYRGLDQTRRCVESVLANGQRTPLEVVAINDRSPEPAISEYLARLAGTGRVTLLTNEANEGFVRSVNRGMALHRDRDVILLNSDTEVANDWADRLLAAAASQPNVATVTPFSNNATICSYPYEGCGAGVPGGLGLAALDRIFASANAGVTFELPTAVGFCMLIRRACLDAIGPFDAERFGRGYGEENDFSMRASKAGWKNLLAADVFVFHEGAVSFQAERQELAKAANEALVSAHPEYTKLVRDFIVADPLRPLRDAVDKARIAQDTREALAVAAERSTEHAALLGRFRQVEKFASERDAQVGEAHRALIEAQDLVALERKHREDALAERMRAVAELSAEIDRLRAGLAHAESLAFARQDEIQSIQGHWMWPLFKFFRGDPGESPPPESKG